MPSTKSLVEQVEILTVMHTSLFISAFLIFSYLCKWNNFWEIGPLVDLLSKGWEYNHNQWSFLALSSGDPRWFLSIHYSELWEAFGHIQRVQTDLLVINTQ